MGLGTDSRHGYGWIGAGRGPRTHHRRDGRVWVAGDTKGALEGQVGSGQSDAFVMALDSKDGTVKSTVLLGNKANNIATAVGINPASGKVYVAGYTYAPLGSDQVDGYLNILELSADQTVTVLYPNRFTSENAVKAGSTVKLPDNKFEFFAAEPLGKSQILAFVSSTPLNLYREANAGVDASGFRTFVSLEACNCPGVAGQKVVAAGMVTLEIVR